MHDLKIPMEMWEWNCKRGFVEFLWSILWHQLPLDIAISELSHQPRKRGSKRRRTNEPTGLWCLGQQLCKKTVLFPFLSLRREKQFHRVPGFVLWLLVSKGVRLGLVGDGCFFKSNFSGRRGNIYLPQASRMFAETG